MLCFLFELRGVELPVFMCEKYQGLPNRLPGQPR